MSRSLSSTSRMREIEKNTASKLLRDKITLAGSGLAADALPVYTSAQLAAMSTNDLIDAVTSTDYEGIRALWTFDSNVATVISESNVDVFVARMVTESADLSWNASSIYQILVYLHIAAYHEFWEASVSYSSAMHDDVDSALQGVAASGDFLTAGATLALVRQEWCIAVDVWESMLLVLDDLDALLVRYNNDASLQTNYDETFAIYYLFGGVTRNMANHTADWQNVLSSTFVSETGVFANSTTMDPDAEYLVSWGIYALGRMDELDAPTVSAAHQLLSDAYAAHTPYEYNWLSIVSNLEFFYSSTLSDTTVLDVAQIRVDVEAIAFPNQYSFDGGKLLYYTPLPLTKINDLYDAQQEVESQYRRLSTNLDPVAGDTNQVLHMRIYGSPADYATYQFFLYGLNTNNGGIYIEPWGTFFTYDRAPQESIYTLEELTRHEYVHYLDSRYGIEGNWGAAGTLYDNNRMVWWDEGFAEFIAGSTRDQKVLPRRSLVQNIATDDTRMTIDELIGTTYNNGFKFYRYGGTFFNFLFEGSVARYEIIGNLMKVIRSNDAAAVDAAFAALELDAALQTDFDSYLDQLTADESASARAFWDDVPTAHVSGVSGANSVEILQQIEAQVSVSPGSMLSTTSERFLFQDLVSFSDGGSPPDETYARLTWDAFLDQLLLDLGGRLENFVSATAWFGDIEVAGSNLEATYFLEGPYSITSTLVIDQFAVGNVSPKHFVYDPIPLTVDATTTIGTVVDGFSGSANLYAYEGLGGRQLAIGEGATEWPMFPFNTNAHENRTQVIYTAAEIGEAGILERLALDVAVLPDRVMTNWTIRMQHTTLNAYPTDGSAQWQTGGWTTVFRQNASVTSLGWVWFELDT
ncbi:MAG: collagenase, partial [Candidatus Hydrogenedentota bacterium]